MQTAQDPAGGTPAPGAPGAAPVTPPRLGAAGNGAAARPGVADTRPPPGANGGGAADTGDTGGDDDLDTGGEAPAWGENWRDGLAKGDAARLKRLERFATPDAVADALFAAQDRIRQGGRLPVLPDDATDDEVKAFRKAHGIPEKAADYGLAWPEGLTPTEDDNKALGAFAEFMHARHIPPAAVKAAFEYYTTAQAAAAQQRSEAAHELNLENVAELRREYPGREFRRNMAIAEEYLAKYYEGDEQALDMVLEASLPNGVKVRNFAPFIRGLVKMGRAGADEEALIGGDGAGGGKTLDAEYKELVDKSATQRLSNDEHKRLTQLAEARQARDEKQGRRNQAA